MTEEQRENAIAWAESYRMARWATENGQSPFCNGKPLSPDGRLCCAVGMMLERTDGYYRVAGGGLTTGVFTREVCEAVGMSSWVRNDVIRLHDLGDYDTVQWILDRHAYGAEVGS